MCLYFRVVLIQIDLQLYILLCSLLFYDSVFFPLSSLIFGKFCFQNLVQEETSFAGLLIVDLLSMGWAFW
jgi:hypothetical protein